MCSPLVADPYFSAQAAITHSPSKLALQIGVQRQRRAHCDAASVPQLHHIDQVYRIALEAAGYHTTSTAAYTSRRGAPGDLQFPRPGGGPASTCTTWRAIAEQLAPAAAAPPRSSPARSRGGGIAPIHRCPRRSKDHERTIWIGFGAVIAIFLNDCGDRWAGQKQR